MRGRCRPAGGFTLVEVVVGLALLCVASLLGLAAVQQATLAIERIEAQHRALVEIEAALEAVRAGALPLASGAVGPSLEGVSGPARGLVVRLDVDPGDRPHLFHVVASARYAVRGHPQESAIETLVYQP